MHTSLFKSRQAAKISYVIYGYHKLCHIYLHKYPKSVTLH